MRMEPVRRWAAEWADLLGVAAFGSADFLSLGMFMPDWFARTSWSSGNQNRGTTIIDSPASYVGLMSLCGLVAFVALAVALWQRRLTVAAALVAAAAFVGAVYLTGTTWLSLSRGMALLDGRPAVDMVPPRWTVHLRIAICPRLSVTTACEIGGTVQSLARGKYGASGGVSCAAALRLPSSIMVSALTSNRRILMDALPSTD